MITDRAKRRIDKLLNHFFVLHFMEMSVPAVFFQQIIMEAHFFDLALAEHNRFVQFRDRIRKINSPFQSLSKPRIDNADLQHHLDNPYQTRSKLHQVHQTETQLGSRMESRPHL